MTIFLFYFIIFSLIFQIFVFIHFFHTWNPIQCGTYSTITQHLINQNKYLILFAKTVALNSMYVWFTTCIDYCLWNVFVFLFVEQINYIVFSVFLIFESLFFLFPSVEQINYRIFSDFLIIESFYFLTYFCSNSWSKINEYMIKLWTGYQFFTKIFSSCTVYLLSVKQNWQYKPCVKLLYLTSLNISTCLRLTEY